jgi:uncharacterized protein (TIGR02001 family)
MSSPNTHRRALAPAAPGTLVAAALGTLVALAVVPAQATGQSVSIGADVVSRYVWRGLDFGESMAVQPALTLGAGGFEFGAWGSYSISADGASANENDLWAAYTITTESGASIAVGVTDYYFPGPGATGFSYKDAHTWEVSLAFSGPETFPLSLFAGLVTDDDKPLYLEAGLPLPAGDDVELGLHAGMVTGESAFYGTGGAAVVNLGITAGKELTITDSFAIPTSVSYVFNPDQDRAFLVFGISLAP